jgi:solute carrier family 39 (zinc transporter), member 1/2/3
VTAIIFHQLFEGLSLGIRIAGLPPSSKHKYNHSGKKPREWLQPTLSFLFAITTPIGIGIGLAFLQSSHKGPSSGSASSAKMLLMQGVMSAVSAGMLIYAATVEMLAADFVFGSLGHGGGGHSHAHAHGEEFTGDDEHGEDGGGGGWKRRVLAVVSLLAGVLMMALIGLGE